MKTLLLSLVVVAFVYLEPGYPILCYSCTRLLCNTFKNCSDAEACYKTWKGIEVVKGCGCPSPGENEKVTCCAKDKCNF
ncbi:toxin 3FTx-Lei1-like [Pituophis catenifer annectens]|uniref:toxin 3FTx-Lei1-like n=1 Tax=Pituophis catenifer annectens TaxID=94852 RepID=UPI003994F6A8